MKPCQPGILPTNTIHNPKNDGNCIIVITRGGKQTIDLSISSIVECDMRKDKYVVEARGELVDQTTKKVEVSQKVVHIPVTSEEHRLPLRELRLTS